GGRRSTAPTAGLAGSKAGRRGRGEGRTRELGGWRPLPGPVKSQAGVLTICQGRRLKIGHQMIDLARCWAARALVAALPLVGLAACATPTLIDHVGIEPERPPDAPPRVLDRTARLQCAPFARQASGIQIYGNANTWWRQAAGR